VFVCVGVALLVLVGCGEGVPASLFDSLPGLSLLGLSLPGLSLPGLLGAATAPLEFPTAVEPVDEGLGVDAAGGVVGLVAAAAGGGDVAGGVLAIAAGML
jgi:hypothetical protein